ncbi:MAG: hypothetical protein AAFR74_05790 [Pseudomonadota bacterium]
MIAIQLAFKLEQLREVVQNSPRELPRTPRLWHQHMHECMSLLRKINKYMIFNDNNLSCSRDATQSKAKFMQSKIGCRTDAIYNCILKRLQTKGFCMTAFVMAA